MLPEKKAEMDEKLSDDRVLMSCTYGLAYFDVLEIQVSPRHHGALD